MQTKSETRPSAATLLDDFTPWSRAELADEIEDFLAETGMRPTPFGIAAARDDKLLWRIKNAPNGISLDKADRVRAYMRAYRLEHPRTSHDIKSKQPLAADIGRARPRSLKTPA